jgi:iron complex outermembrane receptor protein
MRQGLIGLPAAVLSWAAVLSGVVAGGALAPQPAVAQGQAGQVQLAAFEIAAGPLPLALTAFGRQSGYQVSFDPQGFASLQAARVSGTMSPDEALRRMLAGTGVTFRYTEARSIVLDPPPQGRGAAVLPTLSVEGTRRPETAYGPVEGYVATRAASASKTDTPLIELPQSVSVVTRDEMEVRAVTSVADALSYTPGVRSGLLGDANGYGGDSTAVRGFGGNGTSGPSFNEYIDGMKLQGSGYVRSGMDPYFFERVEVLKGPASVLYGQAIPGGLINMVSKRPTATPQGEVELQYGSFDRKQGHFDVSNSLDAERTLSYRFSGVILDTSTQTDFSDRKRVAVAPAFTWAPSVDTTLTLLTRYQHDDFDGSPLNWMPSRGTVRDNPNGQISRSLYAGDTSYDKWDRYYYSAGYLFEHVLSDAFTFRQNFAYNRNDLDNQNIYITTLQANGRYANRQAFGMTEHSKDYTLDNQLQATFTTGPLKHTLLTGLDAQVFRNSTDRVVGTPTALDLYNPGYGNSPGTLTVNARSKTDADQQGFYLQDQIQWDRWHLLLGLRRDWAESETLNQVSGARTPQSDRADTKRVGLLHAFPNGISPYVSYTESFEPTVATLLLGGGLAQPSEGAQWETGIKYQPPGSRSMITASVYELTRSNVTTPSGVTGYSLQNGEVQSRGFELEAKVAPMTGLNVIAGYAYTDAEITSTRNTATTITGATVSMQGKTPTRAPVHTASAWADYTLQSGPMRGFGFGAGVRYVGTAEGDDANSFEVPAFALFDAGLFYDLGNLRPDFSGWQASLNASNLLDKDYISTCFGDNRCYFGTGRTVIAGLKYKW